MEAGMAAAWTMPTEVRLNRCCSATALSTSLPIWTRVSSFAFDDGMSTHPSQP